MNPFFDTGFSISDSLKSVRKSVLIYETIIKQTSGYQIQYSASKKFKGAKTVTIRKNKTTSATVKKLKAKKKYYVRIRTYKTVKVNGKAKKLYSNWSNVKTVTTKN